MSLILQIEPETELDVEVQGLVLEVVQHIAAIVEVIFHARF